MPSNGKPFVYIVLVAFRKACCWCS